VIRILPVLAIAAYTAAAQAPKVGEINFYGLHKLPPERLLNLLAIKTGDALPPSKGELEQRLTEVDGVVDARIEAVCCDGRDATLFIGIEERGGPHFGTHNAPSGNATLPEDLLNQYHEYVSAVARAAANGAAAEDLSAGHSHMADPAVRRLQDGFAAYAADNLPLLRDVLRNGSEAEERAVAAIVIGYAPKKTVVLDDLQYALQDANEEVRANSARSLKAIAVLAQKDPRSGIRVAPVWLVEMLNSLVLSDRLEATRALVVLTDQPNPGALELLRGRALSALTEMARWKTLDYALPAFLLLGRTGGIAEADLQDQWQKGDRETAILKAAESASRTRH
jgi:hypothetical protein